MTAEQATLYLALAGGLSSLIGYERQWRNRLAGCANTLVALGAASYVIFAALFPNEGSFSYPHLKDHSSRPEES